MNDQLQSKLVEILNQIQQAVATTATWSWDQVNDVAYQYVMFYRVWYSFSSIALLILVVAVMYFGTKLMIKGNEINQKAKYPELQPGFGHQLSGFVLWAFTGFLLLPGFYFSIKDLILVWFAPKVFLLQTIADLISRHSK